MKPTSVRIRLTPDRLARLDKMAAMMAMSRAEFIKLVLDDKWLQLIDRGMVAAYEEMRRSHES